jgi:hypothetical protein
MSRNRIRERISFSLSLTDGPLSYRPSRCLPHIMMMEASYVRQGEHLAHLWGLDSVGVGAIHCQGKMGTKAVVIGDVCSAYAPEMPVVEDDDMIEYIATDTPDEPLAGGIVPRTARGDLDCFNAHVLDAVLERHTENRVPIPQERARRGLPGQCLNDVLGRPLCCVMCSDRKMHHATALMREQEKDKEHAACGGRDEKKIAGDDVMDMIGEKCLPGR